MILKKVRGKKRRQRNLKNFIPKGHYCYTRMGDGEIEVCPFYRNDKNKHHQENGICEAFKMRDDIMGGLLWDMVKECDVNDELEDEYEVVKDESINFRWDQIPEELI